MAKMSSSTESLLLSVIKAAAAFFQAMPMGAALWIARQAGRIGYYAAPKKRAVVYLNLKTVFAGRKSPTEIRRIARETFPNFTQGFVEILCLPKIKRMGFERLVRLQGKENIAAAMQKGKGLIFLAMHSGSWELASVVGSLSGYPYNVVANLQPKTPKIDELLNEYRRIVGAKVIASGVATRGIIRALQNNEIVSLVLDQGGKDGTVVKFLGKTASMSTGAVRLGLKYGTPVCPVWITREGNARHCLTFYPPLDFSGIEDTPQGLVEATRKAAAHFEGLIYARPEEYLWFYKVFKYSDEANVLVLDDRKTGHLRQSQAVAQVLQDCLAGRGKKAPLTTMAVDFKSPRAARAFALYVFLAQAFRFLLRENALGLFLTPASHQALIGSRPDFIISCGSSAGGMNFFLKSCWKARAICVLKPGAVSWERFDLVIAPEHDRPPRPLRTKMVLTKAALNLITPEYLQEQAGQLAGRYPRLKDNARAKIGLLLGGDTKGVVFTEEQARVLIRQVKEAAQRFDADILVTTSRRTSAAVDALVAKEFKGFQRCPLCIIVNEHNVPEAIGGILGLSGLLLVSGESISMVSEAVCSGKKTVVFSPSGDYGRPAANKYDRFVLGLHGNKSVLACAIKDLSAAIADMLGNKFIPQVPDDRGALRQAIEGIL